MQTSQRGIEFLKRHENEVLRLYSDPVGNCSIGFGHLVHIRPCLGDSANNTAADRTTEQPYANGLRDQDATALLLQDVASVERVINNLVSGHLTQEQFDALVSFTFNVGVGTFGKSPLPTLLEAGDLQGASDVMLTYVWARNRRPDGQTGRVRLDGLVLRRRDEVSLFLYGAY